ncbi:GNAT family N-acetyltransferase [Asanoa siamensis]|uniref:N-acetyltransferase GCN5 n=1 Tax=Asanoa siamensis TaxID=926357 RepID=A0ABQ4CY07_9ACTN|nr:GNAT family N-acetyltransferase [Asanoa siamensis]GIF76181.1 N-acetyltransferase GCN5 [Asanoa siamensis]
MSVAVPLTAAHPVGGFDCGSAGQSRWLVEQALLQQRAGRCRVYVVPGAQRVVGYYALAAGSVAPASVPRRLARDRARFRHPVLMVTRLGVDRSVRRTGLGRALVADALHRIAAAAEPTGIRAALLRCDSIAARDFYLHLAAFEPSPTNPMHLLLSVKDLHLALRR